MTLELVLVYIHFRLANKIFYKYALIYINKFRETYMVLVTYVLVYILNMWNYIKYNFKNKNVFRALLRQKNDFSLVSGH